MAYRRKNNRSIRKVKNNISVAVSTLGLILGAGGLSLTLAGSAGAATLNTLPGPSGQGGVIDEGPAPATAGVPASKLAALGRLNAQHSSSGSASSIQPAYSAGSLTLSVVVQPQTTSYYCVPASSRVTLSAFISSLPSQDTLASQLGTTSSGTYMSNVPAVLNSYQSRNPYVFTSATSLTDLQDRIQVDIQLYTAPLQNQVQMGLLPWYGGTLLGHHDIATYGYNYAPNVSNANVYDPWNDPRAGRKTITTPALYNAGAPESYNLVW